MAQKFLCKCTSHHLFLYKFNNNLMAFDITRSDLTHGDLNSASVFLVLRLVNPYNSGSTPLQCQQGADLLHCFLKLHAHHFQHVFLCATTMHRGPHHETKFETSKVMEYYRAHQYSSHADNITYMKPESDYSTILDKVNASKSIEEHRASYIISMDSNCVLGARDSEVVSQIRRLQQELVNRINANQHSGVYKYWFLYTPSGVSGGELESSGSRTSDHLVRLQGTTLALENTDGIALNTLQQEYKQGKRPGTVEPEISSTDLVGKNPSGRMSAMHFSKITNGSASSVPSWWPLSLAFAFLIPVILWRFLSTIVATAWHMRQRIHAWFMGVRLSGVHIAVVHHCTPELVKADCLPQHLLNNSFIYSVQRDLYTTRILSHKIDRESTSLDYKLRHDFFRELDTFHSNNHVNNDRQDFFTDATLDDNATYLVPACNNTAAVISFARRAGSYAFENHIYFARGLKWNTRLLAIVKMLFRPFGDFLALYLFAKILFYNPLLHMTTKYPPLPIFGKESLVLYANVLKTLLIAAFIYYTFVRRSALVMHLSWLHKKYASGQGMGALAVYIVFHVPMALVLSIFCAFGDAYLLAKAFFKKL